MGRKSGHELPAAERGRRPSDGAGKLSPERGRWSSRRKMEVVLRLLKGETLDSLSRELGVTASRLSQWREQFLKGGQGMLKSRQPDARDEETRRLQAKIGEMTMENELLYQKIERLEAGLPPARRRSRR
jgi:transposase-like protein